LHGSSEAGRQPDAPQRIVGAHHGGFFGSPVLYGLRSFRQGKLPGGNFTINSFQGNLTNLF